MPDPISAPMRSALESSTTNPASSIAIIDAATP